MCHDSCHFSILFVCRLFKAIEYPFKLPGLCASNLWIINIDFIVQWSLKISGNNIKLFDYIDVSEHKRYHGFRRLWLCSRCIWSIKLIDLFIYSSLTSVIPKAEGICSQQKHKQPTK
jgi:hypothetical protein